VETELFHEDGQMERPDEANGRFLHFCGIAQKNLDNYSVKSGTVLIACSVTTLYLYKYVTSVCYTSDWLYLNFTIHQSSRASLPEFKPKEYIKKCILDAEGMQGGRSRNAEYILHIIKVSLPVLYRHQGTAKFGISCSPCGKKHDDSHA